MKMEKNAGTESENCIYLKDLITRGIHIDKESDFDTSIFADVYKNAKQSVERIVTDNRLWKKPGYAQKNLQKISISNVISFIGRRGTGKSSAMFSFREALEQYNDGGRCRAGSKKMRFSEEAEMEDIRFFSLDYIDASVLEESEDIFVLVLANLLNYIDEINRQDDRVNCDFRNLLTKFETIYNDFMAIKETSQRRNEVYSSYEKMRNIASSQRIRSQFYELVMDCLKYIGRKGKSEAEETYLVISIDDLDMAHYNTQNNQKSYVNNKSYEIVNCIHKYLAVPGVIVLTAYNHVNLMLQCENFFINSDTTPYQSEQDRESQRKSSTKLSNQFVDKAFAVNYRIYMPSWKKSDYLGKRFRVDVVTGMDKKDNIFSRHCRQGERCLTIKKFVLIMYAEKIGVYYDCKGKKIHFLEPDSLRKLSDMVALMGDLTEEGNCCREEDKKLACRLESYKKIKGDIYFRFIQERLYLPEEKEFFNDLLELRIDRRSEQIVQKCCQKTARLGKSVKRLIKERNDEIEKALYLNLLSTEKISDMENMISEASDNRNIKYSYAELLHSIYHMTRDEKGYSRELVDCILHSYSVHLSELYDEYRAAKLTLGKKNVISRFRYPDKGLDMKADPDGSLVSTMVRNHEIFGGVIGDSVCGRWCEYFFPEVTTNLLGWQRRDRKPAPIILGCCRENEMCYKIELPDDDEKIKLAIKTFLFLFMLHKDVLGWEKMVFTGKVKKKTEKQVAGAAANVEVQPDFELEFSIEEPQDIELTAFFKYMFLYPEFLKKMENLLLQAVSRDQQDDQWTPEMKAKVEKAINAVINELWDSFASWDMKYGNMILPLHNFDLTYNMIKRIFQKMEKRRESVLIDEKNTFLNEFDKMNQLFGNYLTELDQYYGLEKKKRRFYSVFEQCPYFKLLKEIGAGGSPKIIETKIDKKNNNEIKNVFFSDIIEKQITALIAGQTAGYELGRSPDSKQEGDRL